MDKTHIFIARCSAHLSSSHLFFWFYYFSRSCNVSIATPPPPSPAHYDIDFLWQSTIANKLLWCSIVFAAVTLLRLLLLLVVLLRGGIRYEAQVQFNLLLLQFAFANRLYIFPC